MVKKEKITAFFLILAMIVMLMPIADMQAAEKTASLMKSQYHRLNRWY